MAFPGHDQCVYPPQGSEIACKFHSPQCHFGYGVYRKLPILRRSRKEDAPVYNTRKSEKPRGERNTVRSCLQDAITLTTYTTAAAIVLLLWHFRTYIRTLSMLSSGLLCIFCKMASRKRKVENNYAMRSVMVTVFSAAAANFFFFYSKKFRKNKKEIEDALV